MDKKGVIARLGRTFCRLRPSRISGVGVFAIRGIPKGKSPFPSRKCRWHKIMPSELDGLDSEVKKMVVDFFVLDKDKGFWVPEYALDGMDCSFFVNHSGKPNVRAVKGGENFVAIRDIKKGEELTSSYSTYDYRYRDGVRFGAKKGKKRGKAKA